MNTSLVDHEHHRRYRRAVPEIPIPDQRPPEVNLVDNQQPLASPGGTTASRNLFADRCTDNPPSYDTLSPRMEENPSDACLPPPSYEEVMIRGFTDIRTEINAEWVNQRQEHSQYSQDCNESAIQCPV